MQTPHRMPRLVPWLIAGLLIAGTLVVAFRDWPASSPSSAGEAASTETDVALAGGGTGIESLPPSERRDEPPGLGARLLSDSDTTRRSLLGKTIREAGYDCPDVRAADALDSNGHAWRANCGELRLYWIEIDDFGRMSVEPGAYDDSGFGVDGAGGRTLTTQPEDRALR
jgi:hypothetical protein